MYEERQARAIRRSIVLLIALFILGYAGTRTFAFIRGPVLKVDYPQDYLVVRQPLISVQGTAARIATLHINGREIFTNEEGVFEDRLLVPPGYSIMTLTAQDQFGRSITKTIHLIREEYGT